MGVKKSRELQVPVPVHTCYGELRKIAFELDWKVLEDDKNNCVMKWESKGSLRYKKAIITTSLRRLPPDSTNIVLTGELPGVALVDGSGSIPAAWKLLLEPFERVIATTYMVREGLLCPTCGQQLPQGTRFCPKDGTSIAMECSKCGNTNPPSAQFCSICGVKLQDN